jgi:hypothetical protein
MNGNRVTKSYHLCPLGVPGFGLAGSRLPKTLDQKPGFLAGAGAPPSPAVT